MGAQEERRRALLRTTAWALVAGLHVLFVLCFVLGIKPFDLGSRPIIETILDLQMPGNEQARERPVNPQPLTEAPPRMLSAPVPIIKPPPIVIEEPNKGPAQPGDILGAVGRELACSAGSWEHLTTVERQRCGLYPWRGMRLPNGSLVMVPKSVLPRLKEAPQTEFSVNSGADRLQSDVRTGMSASQNGCPILQNTPCLHVSPGMRAATGDN